MATVRVQFLEAKAIIDCVIGDIFSRLQCVFQHLFVAMYTHNCTHSYTNTHAHVLFLLLHACSHPDSFLTVC